MNSRTLLPSLSLLAFLVLELAAQPAAAQGAPGTASPQGPNSQGPMIVERVKSGFLVAPDVKITEVDNSTSELVGAYAGWLTDQTFFIGGGGYWLANSSGDRDMGYGGLVVQWFVRAREPIGFTLKGLIGGGATSASSTVNRVIRVPDGRGGRFDPGRGGTTVAPVRVYTDTGFFVAEPEVDVLVRITRSMRLTAGVGYRFIAAEYGDDSRIRGAVGSIGIQIGGGY
jgi:hypothetical protein